jgi:CelD/BcsL family acetyltransferase involved in cellulose biosynthesis
LRIVLHREIPEDQTLRDRWDELVEQMERPEVFYTYEWALAASCAYRDSITPLLVLGYEGAALAGVIALATDKAQKRAFFLAGATADYCDFVSSPELLSEFVNAVFAELRKLNLRMIVFANLPADSATSDALGRAASDHGYSSFRRPGYECERIEFASPQQRALVKQSVQRKQLRYNLKAMVKIAPVAVSHSRSWDDVANTLPGFVKAHIARFLATGRISNLVRPERRVFLSELARLCSRRGWIVHSRLMIGERPAAWNYGFQFAGSWFWYQPTFQSDLKQYSPGFCLLSKIVEEACDTPGMNLVDLGLGSENYKERLATGTRQTVHITATTSRMVWAKEVVRYHLAGVIKSMPRLENAIRSTLNQVSLLRKRFHNGGPVGLLRSSWRWCRKALFGQSEMFFFEWREGISSVVSPDSDSLSIEPLDLNLLAIAAMNYFDDPETLTYLLRAAKQLISVELQGFALLRSDGVPVHFCWATRFEGFRVKELNHILEAPSLDSVLLFDCWTPPSVRGRRYGSMAISYVAARLRDSGKTPWIFSAAANTPFTRGAEKSAFTLRFSLTRKRRIFLGKVIQSKSLINAPTPVDVSSAA